MARLRVDDRQVLLFCFTLVIFICLMLYQITLQRSGFGEDVTNGENVKERALPREQRIVVPRSEPITPLPPRESKCTYWQCVDSYKCGPNSKGLISVYVYPLAEYYDRNDTRISPRLSREFERLLLAIVNSDFYTDDADEACIYVPSVDLLNEQNCDTSGVASILQSLKYWAGGTNHLLFNMLTRRDAELNTVISIPHGKAVVAGGGFSHRTYRRTFDVSIPVYNPAWDEAEAASFSSPLLLSGGDRKWLLVSAQAGIHESYRRQLTTLAAGRRDVLILRACSGSSRSEPPPGASPDNVVALCDDRRHAYSYGDVLRQATFCLVLRTAWLGTAALGDALRAGCIPVIVADAYVMPFSEAIDWKRAAVFMREHDLQDGGSHVLATLDDIARSTPAVDAMRCQARFLWERYFGSIEAVALTALRVINDRVFPHRGWTYEQWNGGGRGGSISDDAGRSSAAPRSPGANPLGVVPIVPSRAQGFTAVVLTYDRVEQLFDVVRHLAGVPSLAKVLVVWNNQNLSPPPAEQWPSVRNGSVPLVVRRASANRLSNRFYPYDEITTDCVLSMDDDITMLTADELQFGYEVWRENSDRIVGYPPRVHVWDNATDSWKYESQWVNDVSMVLTGAAFYHKYFNFLYTYRLPGNIKEWVDEHMNCEDIAMNYLATNVTGKAPIKVLQRMKFRSSMDSNLSNDILMYMVERNECMKKFTSDFGVMPLLAVDFRADPVLYGDSIVDDVKLFPDTGSL